MYILGINMGHDASACLLHNGVLLHAIEEEKLCRKKSVSGFPILAVEWVLQAASCDKKDISVISFGDRGYFNISYWQILKQFSNDKTQSIGIATTLWILLQRYSYQKIDFIHRIFSFFRLLPSPIQDKNKDLLEKKIRQLGFINTRLEYHEHHLSHAASACFATSNFSPNLVITCDGRGEHSAFNAYDSNLNLLHENDYTTSIGQVYSVVTQFLGFLPNRHEGKIMGLAAFGKPTPLCEAMNDLFFYDPKNQEKLQRKPQQSPDTLSKKLLSLRKRISFQSNLRNEGYHYALATEWLLQWLRENAQNYEPKEVAFAVQQLTEKVVLREIKRIIAKSGLSEVHLSLAGGVFANVKLNQRLLALKEVKNIFIQPAMSDAGLSLGAAYLSYYKQNTAFLNPFPHSYWGYEATNEEIKAFVENITDKEIIACDAQYSQVAELLTQNVIVGWYQGALEWGPRALGNRSIVCNTFRREVNDELNKRLNRTEFMPFAPSMLLEYADMYLIDFQENCPATDYMTITYDVKPEYHQPLQAVTHVDGTCRPHIVKAEQNEPYYQLLKSFAHLTGCGAVVNTSFNVHEEPIVATPSQAYKALQEGRIDALVLHQYLIYPKNVV